MNKNIFDDSKIKNYLLSHNITIDTIIGLIESNLSRMHISPIFMATIKEQLKQYLESNNITIDYIIKMIKKMINNNYKLLNNIEYRIASQLATNFYQKIRYKLRPMSSSEMDAEIKILKEKVLTQDKQIENLKTEIKLLKNKIMGIPDNIIDTQMDNINLKMNMNMNLDIERDIPPNFAPPEPPFDVSSSKSDDSEAEAEAETEAEAEPESEADEAFTSTSSTPSTPSTPSESRASTPKSPKEELDKNFQHFFSNFENVGKKMAINFIKSLTFTPNEKKNN
jgi:hypothetical protein